jgi:hypothetical protein
VHRAPARGRGPISRQRSAASALLSSRVAAGERRARAARRVERGVRRRGALWLGSLRPRGGREQRAADEGEGGVGERATSGHCGTSSGSDDGGEARILRSGSAGAQALAASPTRTRPLTTALRTRRCHTPPSACTPPRAGAPPAPPAPPSSPRRHSPPPSSPPAAAGSDRGGAADSARAGGATAAREGTPPPVPATTAASPSRPASARRCSPTASATRGTWPWRPTATST